MKCARVGKGYYASVGIFAQMQPEVITRGM